MLGKVIKMKKTMFIVILSVSLLVIGCSGESGNDGDESLSIGTTNTSSSLYAYYSGLQKSVEEQAPDISMTVMETGATEDNITRLENGQIDIGLAVLDGAYEAHEGIGDWEGNSQDELRNLFTYTENALYYVVTDESGITEFQDLEGEKFNLGIKGSTTESQTKAILNLLDITPDVHVGDVDDAVNLIKDGELSGLTKTGVGTSGDATIMDLETSKDLHLLGYTEDEIEKITDEFPWLRMTEIPDDVYDWQDETVTTLAQQIGNIATPNLSEETAYKITKAAFEEKEYQEESYDAVGEVDFEDLIKESPIPLHAGSVKYLKEQDIDIPDELIPEEYEED